MYLNLGFQLQPHEHPALEAGMMVKTVVMGTVDKAVLILTDYERLADGIELGEGNGHVDEADMGHVDIGWVDMGLSD